ncbi:lipopolysaccharide transport periplasmic protein LptA [Pusillimonas sp. ANT_WB101]|nr:lipopolysaccharide transport periplasmic protein LptA [Pusillimonas sp. ANT_WB101]
MTGLAWAQSSTAPAVAQPSATAAQPSPGKAPAASQSNGKVPSAAPAAASKDDAQDPDTIILSDTLTYDDVKKQSVFTGNVIMTRGLMTLTADKLVLNEDADGNQFGTATVAPGKLVKIRQENPEKFEVLEALGLRGEYDGKKEQIEMIGQAVVTRYVCGKPFDNVKGERVIYHQKTGTYEAFGGPQSAAHGGRVRSVAQPKTKTDAAVAECQKKSASTQ